MTDPARLSIPRRGEAVPVAVPASNTGTG